MAITLAQLSAFLAVAREGSVTAAAEVLAVSQPSVSGAVAGLGRELGCELLERSGRGVRLSPAGLAFAPYAGDLLGLVAEGRAAAGIAAGLTARRLRVLALTSAAEAFVPALIAAFRRSHAAIDVSLSVVGERELFAMVAGHEADVGICDALPADPRLVADPLLEDPFVCVVAADDELVAGRAVVELGSLADRVWLLREPGSGTRGIVERFLSGAGLAPSTMTLGSNAAVAAAAGAGLGVAVVSRAVAAPALSAGLLAELPLSGGTPVRTWFAVWSRIGPPRPVVGAFLDCARTEGETRWR